MPVTQLSTPGIATGNLRPRRVAKPFYFSSVSSAETEEGGIAASSEPDWRADFFAIATPG